MQKSIRGLFSGHRDALAEVTRSARQAETLIETISQFIEAYTSEVCPACTSVCCINRHSAFDRSDVIFMTALGKHIPEASPGVAETDACRFMGSRGCTRKRSERPYRCTWYFCSALMEQIMDMESASEYRQFLEILRTITEVRMIMINNFETVSGHLLLSLESPQKTN